MHKAADIKIERGKLLGSRFLAHIFEGVRERVFPLRLRLEGDAKYLKLPWNTSRLQDGSVRLQRTKEGVEIRLIKARKDPFYIVLNSHPHYFKKLKFAGGVATKEIDSLSIGCFGRNDPTLSCSLVVVEFNRNYERIGSFTVPLNMTDIYRPSPEAWRTVFCLQFKGAGVCTISGVRLASVGAMNQLSTQPNKGYSVPARNQMNSFAYETLLELARSLPVSDGCRYYKKIPLKVGIITDVFMYNFYKDVFKEVHYLSPDNYEDVFASKSLDIVLYVTCWKGIMNEEWRGIKFRKKPGKAFNAILDHARRQGMKLVFQSIEDPSNFEHFLPIAKQFDYIFTSDTETIERYKAECGHERVFHGEYGANPRFNNPIGSRRHTLNAAFFAGSWAGRYPERCKDMETIFDSILSSDDQLIIADRNYGSKSEDFCYPERFQGNIIPPIEHALLQSMHKLFRYNINFNSIKDSPTMCAMRVYEMQAMGVGIFSNYARSVFNKFPEIRIIPWQQDLEKAFILPAEGDFGEYHRNMALLRNVLNDKTAHNIATRMVQAIGIKKVKLKKPVICVICDQDTATVQANFDRQGYDARVLVRASKINTPNKWKTFAKANGVAYFTWFTGKDEYEENYLDDLANAFKYTNARYVTRLAWFDGKVFHEGTQHDYMTCMGGKARTLFAAEEFSPQEFIKHTPHESINGLIGGYAVDPFELNYQRYLKRQGRKSVNPKPVLSVIVPVFNNGRFLRAKCIESLKRNQLWPRMEVLLVDDGSTNPETIAAVKDLAREHPNIRTFFYRTRGGSGSASRPRNKGIELATAPLISFLDPDNEISPGGYDTLCALFEETAGQQKGGVDFVSGYHVKVEGQVSKSIGKHSSERLSIINDLKEGILMKGRFPVIPTQPAVIVRHLFDNPDFRFVEKAAGQDTLFGWELLCQAKNGAFTNAAYLTYFAERTDSVTNAIDSSYFEKKLILEKAQTAMLERNGLMATHLEHHYENFMRDWYLVKLEMVENKAERVRCRKILEEIAMLYGQELPKSNLLDKVA